MTKKIKTRVFSSSTRFLDSIDSLLSQNVFLASGCGACGCGACGSCTSCPSCSDKRFKKNIVPLTNALEKLDRIKGVYFNWNDTFKRVYNTTTSKRQIGLIAQDVEVVFPEVVEKKGSKKYRAIYYDKLVSVLVEAVKELKKGNSSLTLRLSQIEKKLNK